MAKAANEVVLTPQLDAVVSIDVAVGETSKVEAAAGAGKSTALRLYTERRRARELPRTLEDTCAATLGAAKQPIVFG